MNIFANSLYEKRFKKKIFKIMPEIFEYPIIINVKLANNKHVNFFQGLPLSFNENVMGPG